MGRVSSCFDAPLSGVGHVSRCGPDGAAPQPELLGQSPRSGGGHPRPRETRPLPSPRPAPTLGAVVLPCLVALSLSIQQNPFFARSHLLLKASAASPCRNESVRALTPGRVFVPLMHAFSSGCPTAARCPSRRWAPGYTCPAFRFASFAPLVLPEGPHSAFEMVLLSQLWRFCLAD